MNGGGEAAGVVEERGSGGVALRTEDVAVGEEKVVEKTDMHSMVLIDELAIPGEDFSLPCCQSLEIHKHDDGMDDVAHFMVLGLRRNQCC